eukprot:365112-Chlamydomonas_euryale.AAC.3
MGLSSPISGSLPPCGVLFPRSFPAREPALPVGPSRGAAARPTIGQAGRALLAQGRRAAPQHSPVPPPLPPPSQLCPRLATVCSCATNTQSSWTSCAGASRSRCCWRGPTAWLGTCG